MLPARARVGGLGESGDDQPRKATWRRWYLSQLLIRWGSRHEEQEEGGVSDEEPWGNGRYGWEILWGRPCRLTLRILGITLQLGPHTCAACGYSQVRADWKLRTPLLFTHTHK